MRDNIRTITIISITLTILGVISAVIFKKHKKRYTIVDMTRFNEEGNKYKREYTTLKM